jgi:ATP-binding cassette subfamily B protein
MASSRRSASSLYRRLLGQARPYWLHIAGVLLLGLLATPVALLTPLPLKIVVDSVLGSHPLPRFLDFLAPAEPSATSLLALAIVLVIAIALLGRLVELGSLLLRTYTGEMLVLNFRSMLFRHVQRLSLSYHDRRGSADSTYRIQYNAPSIQWLIVDGGVRFVNAAIMLLGIVYVTARIDRDLALVALAISPALFLLSRLFVSRLRDQWREVYRLQSSAISVVQEVLGAVRVVTAFGQQEREQQRFERHSSAGFAAQMRATFAEGSFNVLVGLALAAGTAGALLIGARHVQAGELTLGELLVVMTYLTQLYGPLETLSSMVASLQRSFSAAERAYDLLDEAPDVPERPHARALSRATGSVAFREVSFSYDGASPALRDVSFEVRAGTRLGIAGRTGAGKTTLVSLLLRFHDPASGQLLLDGVDLRDYRLADLRNQFSIVLQEPVLLSTSISENIGYALPGAEHEQIVEAARAANAHEFICGLPEGYASEVGERGARLSGGERQRIALARAFLRDSPILVLDEPTSSVDLETEAAIMEAMGRLMRGRTTFMIAHRLETLEACDELIVLRDGRLLEHTADVHAALRRGVELDGDAASTGPDAGRRQLRRS